MANKKVTIAEALEIAVNLLDKRGLEEYIEQVYGTKTEDVE